MFIITLCNVLAAINKPLPLPHVICKKQIYIMTERKSHWSVLTSELTTWFMKRNQGFALVSSNLKTKDRNKIKTN